LGRVTHVDAGIDAVVVPAAVMFAVDVAGVDEVGEDSLGGAFGDADPFSDVSKPDVGATRDCEEYLGVVGEEAPTTRRILI
jgi:hypothetical protein